MSGTGTDHGTALYFFPERSVTADELREILASEDEAQRLWAVSHLLHYAQWDDIWEFVTRDEVRAVFDQLALPESLRTAWARMLKVEAPVG